MTSLRVTNFIWPLSAGFISGDKIIYGYFPSNKYGDMVKAVADVRNGLIAIDAELHSDLEWLLLEIHR